MRSVRLPEHIEMELELLADKKKVSRSEIIKEALVEYLEKEKNRQQPYQTGSPYFGKYGSGESDRSVSYKERIRKKLHEKRTD